MFTPACAIAAVLAAALVCGSVSPAQPGGGAAPAEKAATDSYVLGHTVKSIDGKDADLGQYKGKVVVIVNTASKCGLTPQYEGLQKLYEEKKEAGLVVLGFPANDFRGQEPGTNEEIAAFCESKYGVTFPMFEKIVVTGEGKHPLYAQLAAQAEPIGGEPKWNFTKFVVDREGKVVARFEPRTGPEDAGFRAKIEELLGEKKGEGPKAPAAGA